MSSLTYAQVTVLKEAIEARELALRHLAMDARSLRTAVGIRIAQRCDLDRIVLGGVKDKLCCY